MLLWLLLVTTSPPPGPRQFGGRVVYLMAEGKMPRGAKMEDLTVGQDNVGNETLQEAGKKVIRVHEKRLGFQDRLPTSMKQFTPRRENILLFLWDVKAKVICQERVEKATGILPWWQR